MCTGPSGRSPTHVRRRQTAPSDRRRQNVPCLRPTIPLRPKPPDSIVFGVGNCEKDFGPIVNAKGKPFEELPANIDNRESIFALVRLAMQSEQASADLPTMFDRRLTFARALAPNNTNVLCVQKARLFPIRQALWPQIARAL